MMSRAALALVAMVAMVESGVAQSESGEEPPTSTQIIRACQTDFVRWCGPQMTGLATDRACLRQYWSTLRLDCRVMLRRRAATAAGR